MEMITICAWCQQEDPGNIQLQKAEDSLEQISHGICRFHAHRLRDGFRQTTTTSPLRPLTALSHS